MRLVYHPSTRGNEPNLPRGEKRKNRKKSIFRKYSTFLFWRLPPRTYFLNMATSDLCFVSFKKDFGASFFWGKKIALFPWHWSFSRDSNPNEAAATTTTSVVWRAIAVSFGNASECDDDLVFC
jgi:hypothetical protein